MFIVSACILDYLKHRHASHNAPLQTFQTKYEQHILVIHKSNNQPPRYTYSMKQNEKKKKKENFVCSIKIRKYIRNNVFWIQIRKISTIYGVYRML